MDLLGKLFKSTIDKRVSQQIASNFGSNFGSGVTNAVMSTLGSGLPTLNPDHADYYQSFKTVGAVYETTDLLSKKFIGSPFIFYRIKDKKKFKQAKDLEKSNPVQSFVLKQLAIEEVDGAALTRLLNNPNKYQTGTQFLWSVALSYLLSGNTYIYANRFSGKATELYCFPDMEIKTDREDLLDPVRGYILQDVGLTEFTKEEIYHIKTGTPAPVNEQMEYLYGVAPLRAYLESMRAIKEGNLQASKQVKSGGSIGIVSAANKEDNLSDGQDKALKERMQRAVMSDDDFARVIVASIQMNYQKIGLSPTDLQLLELVGAKEEDIYRAFHVPLSFHNQKASTDNNVGTEVKKLIYDAVKPLCDMMGDSLTRFLGKEFDNVIIEFDYTQLPEMAVNMEEVSKYVIPLVQNGLLTPDEGRQAMRYGETGFNYMKDFYIVGNRTLLRNVYNGISNTNNTNSNNNDNSPSI